MQPGSIILFLFCAVMVCAGSSVEHGDSKQKLIRSSASLCEGEQQFILQRKQVSAQALNKLGINCTQEEVPHVALLGSGGGQRAAVSLVGYLSQLSQDGLLDTVLYLAGVSGSTWSMAHLYSDPQWSHRLDKYKTSLLSSQVDAEVVHSWLNNNTQREDFSLSDVWGVLTAAGIMRQWDSRKLSEEADRNATNPYPVYTAMEKHCFNYGPVEGQWFELSPHEAGFPELERFVETSLLGSSFRDGVLLHQEPEMDMIQLQGILGSALANVMMDYFVPDWLKESALQDKAAQDYLLTYCGIITFINKTKPYVTNEDAVGHMEGLQGTIHAKVSEDQSELLKSLSPEQREQQFQMWNSELQNLVLDSPQTLPEGSTKIHVFSLVRKLLPLVTKWEWGTVKNFLYKYQEEQIPECLSSQQHVHLMDAGPLVNAGYPSFLGQKRDIDLIIAPESSAGEMFQTLTVARDYAAKVQKNFPALDDQVLQEEKVWPRGCYVFEGNATTPAVVFMPLFNRNNCKDAAEWAARMDQFDTIQRRYSPDMIQELLNFSQENMKSCRDVLLTEIDKALQRRRSKQSSERL